MITVQKKIKLIESSFGKVKVSSSGKDVVVICPFCTTVSKTKIFKQKLAINLETGIYHCWVCESKGSNIGKAALKFSIQKKLGKIIRKLRESQIF